MLFNSIDFAVFFPIVFVLYWAVSNNLTARNGLILISSYLFYGWWDWRFLFLIIISSVVDFYVGQRLYSTKNKRIRQYWLYLSLLVNLGFLGYFKYTNFFIDSFVDAFTLFNVELERSTLNIILPVGISFYTFQTLSYTIDIYRNQIKPTKNMLAFFAFVAFFPQLVAGPIERASHLLPQFNKIYGFNYYQVKRGLLLMAFGLFKKMVVADRVAILVNQVYNNPTDYTGVELMVATVFFAFQIYCDFSGYSDIAIGAARTMGFDLMQNFDSPYLSKSITEFWRRWHISLSTWFRDYVYIPLGGSRNGKIKTYSNLFIVFLVSGLWHGAAMTFVIWGAIHGIIIVLEKAFSKQRKKIVTRLNIAQNNIGRKLVFIPIVFIIVCFSWIFFRANNLSDAMVIIQNLNFTNINILFNGEVFNLGLEKIQFVIAILSVLFLIVFEWHHKRVNLQLAISNLRRPFRWGLYIMIGLVLLIFGVYGENQVSEFIYFQF